MPQAVEIVAAPLEVYIAPLGESFPSIDAAIGGNWVQIGSSGSANMADEGLTVQHTQEVNEISVAGATAPVKAFRSSEGLVIGFTLYDLRLEEYSRLLNGNAVTTVAATGTIPGEKSINLYRGVNMVTNALLVRGGASPEQEGENLQYEVPVVYQAGAPEPVFTKSEAAALAFEFMALFDADASAGKELGTLRYKNADTT